MNTTSKKTKFVKNEVLYDAQGEAIPMQMISVEERDFNFHKVWLQNLINSLDGITNQRLKLAFWIIENLTKENLLVMTQRTIAKKAGMSLNTVIRTMKALQEGEKPFLIKINSGAYQVNPEIIWKGSHSNRMGIIFDYNTRASENRTEAQNGSEELEGQMSFDEDERKNA